MARNEIWRIGVAYDIGVGIMKNSMKQHGVRSLAAASYRITYRAA